MKNIKTTECPHCHKQITNNNYKRHINSCKNKDKNKLNLSKFSFNKNTNKYICPICFKEFSEKGICAHYFLQHTKEGQEFKKKEHYANKGNSAWNKGKTKGTDKKVAQQSETLREAYKTGKITSSCLGKHLSEETKQKISKKLMGNKNSPKNAKGYGKQGFYKGVYCASTYELAWVIYNLDHDIKFQKCRKVFEYEFKDKIHNYYPDFELEDGTIIEIKGIHTELVDIKAKAVINKGEKYQILYRKDIQYCFDYIKENYRISDIAKLYDNSSEYTAKLCEYCGKEFKTKNKEQRFCCSLCASKAPKPQNKGMKFMINHSTGELIRTSDIQKQQYLISIGWKFGMK